MWYLTGHWALGYRAGIKIRWYTPFMCRLFGKFQLDKSNGVKVYTHKGVSLLVTPKHKEEK